MSSTTIQPKRSQAVYPGRYFSISRITGAEVLPQQRRAEVEITQSTIHGSANQIMRTGLAMIRAAIASDPALAAQLAEAAPALAAVV